MSAEFRLSDEHLSALATLFGGCPFDEDVNDASMCRCGLPALGHDQAVAATLMRDNPEMFAAVERIVDEAIAGARAEAEFVCFGLHGNYETQMEAEKWAAAEGAERALVARVEATLEATEWNDWPGRHRFCSRLRAALVGSKDGERPGAETVICAARRCTEPGYVRTEADGLLWCNRHALAHKRVYSDLRGDRPTAGGEGD